MAPRRRRLLIAVGSTALAPLAAMHARQAQAQAAMPRVILVIPGTVRTQSMRVEVLRQRLRELGDVEGKNLLLEVRELDSRFEQYPKLMQEIVRTNPQVIVLSGSQAVRADRVIE